jgi:hypothetical protein
MHRKGEARQLTVYKPRGRQNSSVYQLAFCQASYDALDDYYEVHIARALCCAYDTAMALCHSRHPRCLLRPRHIQ